MRLPGTEFIRRFLLHVLPKGFKRIRRYGLLGPAGKAGHLARAALGTAVTTRKADGMRVDGMTAMAVRDAGDHRRPIQRDSIARAPRSAESQPWRDGGRAQFRASIPADDAGTYAIRLISAAPALQSP